MRRLHLYTLTFLLLSLTACNALQKRIDTATSLTSKNGFSKHVIKTHSFNIVSYYKISNSTTSATLFIEGDGLAWLNKNKVSPNPTPTNPVGLKLAINDPSPNVFYLARPCQYVELTSERNCNNQYWTSKRSSKEVIDSINEAITAIKQQFNISTFRLVGYSGGGTIATILSAYRNDIEDLRTVAGNLDIAMFTEHHNVSPLHGSINPIKYAAELISIPQKHYVSENDDIITADITNSYIKHLKQHDQNLHCVDIITTDVYSHTTSWKDYWRKQNHATLRCKPVN